MKIFETLGVSEEGKVGGSSCMSLNEQADQATQAMLASTAQSAIDRLVVAHPLADKCTTMWNQRERVVEKNREQVDDTQGWRPH